MKRKAGRGRRPRPGPRGHGLARRARAFVLPAPAAAGGMWLSRGSVLSREYFPSSLVFTLHLLKRKLKWLGLILWSQIEVYRYFTFCILIRSQAKVWDFGFSDRWSDPWPLYSQRASHWPTVLVSQKNSCNCMNLLAYAMLQSGQGHPKLCHNYPYHHRHSLFSSLFPSEHRLDAFTPVISFICFKKPRRVAWVFTGWMANAGPAHQPTA